jgi:UDP-perosamine 4-acetyltransferase
MVGLFVKKMKGSRKKILVIGAGGHGRVILDCLKETQNWQMGIIERKDFPQKSIFGAQVLGTDGDLVSLFKKGYKQAVIGVGSIGDTTVRRRISSQLKKIGFHLPVIVHPKAIVSKGAAIAEGTVVFPGAVVNTGARIGPCCIINSGAIVEHDCVIGEFTHIAPGARLAGGVIVGNDVHIGIGAVVKEGITISDKVIIGAGAVVLKDIPEARVVVGNPGRFLKVSNRKK